jgi:sulfofructosephosphate aldolase
MPTTARPSLAQLARPSGAFAMVAIDQRESLRSLFTNALGTPPEDALVVDFKLAVAERLAPFGSAMLFDQLYGMPAFEAAGRVPSCARIVAADSLVQRPGGPVDDTDIDMHVDPPAMRAAGAVALKLLVIWRGAESADRCVDLADRFMSRCRAAGLLGIVEAVVPEAHHASAGSQPEVAIVDAARRLAAVGPDLYKCQVPFHGRGSEEATTDVCQQITAALPCPWVVLSQGVAIADFAHALAVACRAGASGFLAGRGIWADAVSAGDYRAQLDDVSAPRLRHLAEIVDELVTRSPAAAADRALGA